MRRLTRKTLVGIVALFFGGVGCSLLEKFDAAQCGNTSDCLARGSQFRNYVCDPTSSSCVQSAALTDATAADTGADAGAEGGSPEGGPCTTNAACYSAHLDQPYKCNHVSGDCVDLTGGGLCPFVLAGSSLNPTYLREDAIFVGGILDIADTEVEPNATPTASVASVVLAFQELQAENNGIPGNAAGAPNRPIVAVLCKRSTKVPIQDGGTPLLTQVENHLVNEVGANAVIAHLQEPDLEAFYSAYTSPGSPGPFIFNPGYTDANLVNYLTGSKGRLWTAIGDARDVAPVYVPLLAQLEATIKGATGLAEINVANLTDSNYSTDLARSQAIRAIILFNGGMTPEANGSRYLEPTPYSTLVQSTQNTAIAQITSAAPPPNVIIVNGRAEALAYVIPQIEKNWTSSFPRPYYILSNELSPANDETGGLNTLLTNQTAGAMLERRIVGVAIESPPTANAPLLAGYTSRISSSFNQIPNYNGGFNNFYDTAYATFFAAYASPTSANYPIGQDYADGMLDLVSGTQPITIGPDPLNSSFGVLVKQRTNNDGGATPVKFVGTMGPWDKSPLSFARLARGSVYCMRALANNKYFYAADVYRYSDASGQLINPAPSACYPNYPN